MLRPTGSTQAKRIWEINLKSVLGPSRLASLPVVPGDTTVGTQLQSTSRFLSMNINFIDRIRKAVISDVAAKQCTATLPKRRRTPLALFLSYSPLLPSSSMLTGLAFFFLSLLPAHASGQLVSAEAQCSPGFDWVRFFRMIPMVNSHYCSCSRL